MNRENKPGSIGIIGGGVAGLIAGCYARMNGYEADIFESHSQPGGLCTSWKKGDDYTIDGCIQWLVGTAPHSGFHKGWLEVGAMQGRTFIQHDFFTSFESPNGKRVYLYSNVDKLEGHLLDFSPPDTKLIRSMCANIRFFTKVDAKQWTLKDLFLAPAYILNLIRAFRTKTPDFAKKFKDPFLREVFNLAGMEKFPIAILFITLAWHHNQNGGYPIGGSLAFARAIEKRFLNLGGRIHYLSQVERILVQENRAVGIRLHDGTERPFDRVISAADGHLTFEHLLAGSYNHEKLYRRFLKLEPFKSMVMVSFGVRRDMTEEPHFLFAPLKEAWVVAGEQQKHLSIRHYGYDPTLAPPGRTILQVGIAGGYDHWKKLHEDRPRYDEEKQALAQKILSLLEERYPGISKQVEVVDVATPVTFERYTHNWRGSIEGWLPDFNSMMNPLPKTLKSLKGLYFAGQWVQPGGGLPTCLMTGRGIIKTICKEDGRRFTASQPEPPLPLGLNPTSPAKGSAEEKLKTTENKSKSVSHR